jgi:hypothetical protein
VAHHARPSWAATAHGRDVSRFSIAADLQSADDLRRVLLDAILRRNADESEIGSFEMDLRRPGDDALITTFVAMTHRPGAG